MRADDPQPGGRDQQQRDHREPDRPRVLAHEQDGTTRSVFYLVRNGTGWDATNVTETAEFPRPFSERSALALDADDAPSIVCWRP